MDKKPKKPKEPKELLSILAYAKRRGCSDTSIHKAIKSGRIVKGVKVIGKKRLIIPSIADKELAENQNPNYDRVTKSGEQTNAHVQQPPTETEPEVQGGQATLAKAKQAQAIYKAKLAELEYKEKSKALVDRNAVYKALFAAGQELRSEFQSIPDRFIDNILAAPSRNEAHRILYEAIASALTKLSDINARDLTVDR